MAADFVLGRKVRKKGEAGAKLSKFCLAFHGFRVQVSPELTSSPLWVSSFKFQVFYPADPDRCRERTGRVSGGGAAVPCNVKRVTCNLEPQSQHLSLPDYKRLQTEVNVYKRLGNWKGRNLGVKNHGNNSQIGKRAVGHPHRCRRLAADQCGAGLAAKAVGSSGKGMAGAG